MTQTRASIDFTVGSRRLFAVGRDLASWSFSLEDILSGSGTMPNPPEPGPDGVRVLSAPKAGVNNVMVCFPHHLIGGRQLDWPPG